MFEMQQTSPTACVVESLDSIFPERFGEAAVTIQKMNRELLGAWENGAKLDVESLRFPFFPVHISTFMQWWPKSNCGSYSPNDGNHGKN